MFSPMLEPLNCSVSVPAWPSTVSLPSPGSHWKVSLPAPELGGVGADVAVDEVVAGAAEQGVGAVAAAQRVVAAAAVERQVRQRADAVLAGDRVGAAEALDDELLDRGVVERLRRWA